MDKIKIVKMSRAEEADTCAQIMASSEPWITLKRTYEMSIQIFNDPDNQTFIALNDKSDLLGVIIISMVGTFKGYIKTIAVNEKIRSKGVGTSLMDFAENYIFEQTPNIFICVSDFNNKAQNFYFNRGFKLIGKIENFLIRGYDELMLRKTVAPLTGYKK
jgi:[ribosomal protein S18]-alanine N-acetyltransferase